MLNCFHKYFLIKRSGLFDHHHYLKTYPDVRAQDIDPIMHFIKFGWKEGRNPSQDFDTQFYLDRYDDVKKQNINPLVHYIKFGQKENRAISKYFEKSNPSNNYEVPNLIRIDSIQPTHHVTGTIAIHIHIFYEDIVNEFVDYLKNMPFNYDLFISVVHKTAQNICENAFSHLPFMENLTIKVVPNRGRDIAPFFCTFNEQLMHYNFIAHIHTKKSLYNLRTTEGWREYLCQGLFGSQDQIKRIFTLMQGEDRYGLIYPQTFHLVPSAGHTWLANEELGKKWCDRLGIHDIPQGYFDFPVGSMFWARGEALAPLFGAGISIEDFSPETGQIDGTMAHCIERLIGLCASLHDLRHGIIKDVKNPSWSSWRLDQYINQSSEDMKNSLINTNIKIIGFNIFDTLFCRPLLNPESAKAIVAHRMGGVLGEQFLAHRLTAEIQARDKKGFDVSLDEIYDRLENISEISQSDLIKLRQLEIEIEIESLTPRIEALQLFNDALATGKKVVLISDTFLPRETIKKTLNKYGITGWCDLIVSNDIGLRKDSGDIYSKLFEQYSIQPSEFLMIGENERSDVQIPSDMGASCLHLLKPTELARGLPRFTRIINDFQQKNDIHAELSLGLVVKKNFSPIHYQDFVPLSLFQTTPYNIGYSLIGPLLTSFSQWLLQRAQEDDIERLYFLSSEGKIIKAVFDKWRDGVKDKPSSHYLILSRRAASVANITSLEDILTIAQTTYFKNTIEKFLYSRYGIKLDSKRWNDLFIKCGINFDSEIEIINGNIDQIYPLLRLLESDIYAKAEIESSALLRYLTEKGLKLNNNQAVVDIGYGGTIQNYLIKMLSMRVNGYYLMTDTRANQITMNTDSEIRGCFGENISLNNSPLIYSNTSNLEKLLSTSDPQIENYYEDRKHRIRENFREISPIVLEQATTRDAILEGAIDFADDACDIRAKLLPKFTPSISVANSLMESFFTDQTEEEVALVNNIVLDDYYSGRDLVH